MRKILKLLTLSRSIDSVQPQDAGAYKCIIVNKEGESELCSKVEILPSERKPAFVADLQDTQSVEGFPVKMQIKVVAHPEPTLKWFHNGQEIIPDNKHCALVQNPDHSCSLIIEKALPTDSGLYEVIATNPLGSSTSKAKLFVAPRIDETVPEESPQFVSALRNANADEGQELVFSAPFIGNPMPEIIWSKDGEPIIPEERILATCDGKHATLTINPAETRDSGIYSCLLANPLGEDTSKCEANVRKVYKKPIFTQKLYDQQQVYGNDAKLQVTVTGVPYPDVSWYFQGKPLEESDAYLIKRDGDHHILVVKNCEQNNQGIYKCIARNREGEDITEGNLELVNEV